MQSFCYRLIFTALLMDSARMRGEIMSLSVESDIELDVSAQINDPKVLSKSLAPGCFSVRGKKGLYILIETL